MRQVKIISTPKKPCNVKRKAELKAMKAKLDRKWSKRW